MVTRSKIVKIKHFDKESRNLAFIAGVSSLGMAIKMSIAEIDIADALVAQKEALKMRQNYNKYFEELTPKMLMNISISAINISKNLDKFEHRVIKYTI